MNSAVLDDMLSLSRTTGHGAIFGFAAKISNVDAAGMGQVDERQVSVVTDLQAAC